MYYLECTADILPGMFSAVDRCSGLLNDIPEYVMDSVWMERLTTWCTTYIFAEGNIFIGDNNLRDLNMWDFNRFPLSKSNNRKP